MTSSCTSSSSSSSSKNVKQSYHPTQPFKQEKHNTKSNSNNLFVNFRWKFTVWRNAPRIWRDSGSALLFQARLTPTKSVLLLSNEHGSQVKDQGRGQCCHNKHNKFPYRPTRDVSLLSGHASYNLGASYFLSHRGTQYILKLCVPHKILVVHGFGSPAMNKIEQMWRTDITRTEVA